MSNANAGKLFYRGKKASQGSACERVDVARLIGELRLDVIVQLWENLSETEPCVAGKYRKLVICD